MVIALLFAIGSKNMYANSFVLIILVYANSYKMILVIANNSDKNTDYFAKNVLTFLLESNHEYNYYVTRKWRNKS